MSALFRALTVGSIFATLAGCRPPASASAQQSPDWSDCYPEPTEKAYTVPELLVRAERYRNAALEEQNRRRVRGATLSSYEVWDASMRNARTCYSSVLQLSRDNYEAHLGMGILYAIAADRSEDGHSMRDSYIAVAKHELGRAYFVRSGPFAPLYYLAVVAVVENDLSSALSFINILQRAQYKPGELHAMLDDINVRQGRYRDAAAHRTMVLEMGASGATLQYASERYRSRLHRKARLP